MDEKQKSLHSLFDAEGNLVINGKVILPDTGTVQSSSAKSTSGMFDENGNLVVAGQVVKPQVTPKPEAQEEADERGFLAQAGDTVADIAQGALNGVQEGVTETLQTVGWAGDELGYAASKLITGEEKNYYIGEGWLTREQVEQANREDRDLGFQPLRALDRATDIDGPETTAGAVTSGVTQFLAGYGAVGRGLKLAKASTKTGAAAQAMGKGAVADFAAFDAHEDRLSDFLRDNFDLRDPVTEWLAADDEDSILEGKVKNAIEGMGLGLATDGLMTVFRAFKKAKRVQIDKGDEAATEVMNEALDEALEVQPDLFDELSDPNIHAGAGKKLADAKAGVEAEAPKGEAVGEVTRHDMKAQVIEPKAGGPVNTDGLTAALTREIGLRRGGSIPDPQRELEGTLFNFDKMDSDIEIKEVMEMAADDIIKHGIKDTTTFDEIVADAKGFLADAVDVSPEVIDGSLRQMAQDAQKQQGIVIAGKGLVQSLSREVELLAEKISAGKATEVDMDKFVRYEQRLVETSANLKSVITGAAQTTAAGRIRTSDWLDGSELATADAIGSHLSKDGGIDGIKARARAIKLNRETKGGAQGLLKIVDTDRATPMRVINEVYINAILSGPKTHAINILSNGWNTFMLPSEKMLGGAARGDMEMMREGARQFAGIRMALGDSWKMMTQAIRSGRNILDPEAAILEANGVNTHAIMYQGDNPVLANVVNGKFGLGNFIRFPSRMLTGGDEFFKQLNYRASLYSRLSTEAADLVVKGDISKADAAQFITERMATAYNAKGGAASQFDLDFAREATFTQDLRQGSWMKSVQDMSNRQPAMKLVMPFIRTPTNIMVAGIQRTPLLRRRSKTLMAELRSGDPRRVAQAQGKLVTGWMAWGTAVTLAASGNITGSGPKDPALRARMMETGWRPYSFKVGDKYVEYKRLEPFAMFLGIAADVADIGGQVGEADMDELAMAGVVGLINNVGSKTFLQGLADVLEAANDPERFLPSLMRRYASSMVPYSAALREARKVGDPEMREVRSIADAIMNTVPAFSDNLPAKRSWITGEPIMYPKGWGAEMMSPVGEALAAANPIIAGEGVDDVVLNELADLDFAFSAPVRKIEGLELTTEQYSRLLELHGTVRVGRYTMHQKLEAVITSERYQRLPKNVSDPTLDPRIKLVRQIIVAYREKARAVLMEEYPEVRGHMVSQRLKLRQNMRGSLSALAPIANVGRD